MANQEFEVTRAMPTGRDAAFAVASDLDQLSRWVRGFDDSNRTGDETVHVHGDVAGEHVDAEGVFDVRPEQYRVEWGSHAGGTDGAYSGWLQVSDEGEGASEIVLHLSFVDLDPPPGLQDALEQSLDRLAASMGAG